ncbi:MAG: MFS transporter [Candidatus Krumholzibacteriota bacterium]|nr:MFS transporter [Candidatus Krumholzibacteriota bacterium]
MNRNTAYAARILAIMLLVFCASSMIRPLLDLQMKLVGINNGHIGKVAMMWEAGALVGAMTLLSLLKRISSRRLLIICLFVFFSLVLAAPLIHTTEVAVAARFLMGCSAMLIHLTCIAGILRINGNHNHATVLAVITASASGTKALGASALGFIGIEGNLSFFVVAALLGLAIPLACSGNIRNTGTDQQVNTGMFTSRVFPLAAAWLLLLVFCVGACRNALVTFLPIHAIEIGLRPEIGTMLLSSSFLGALLLAIPLGKIGDTFGHRGTLAMTATSVVGASIVLLRTQNLIGLLVASSFLLGGGLMAIRDLGMAFWTSRSEDNTGVLAWCSLAGGVGSGLGIFGTGMLMDSFGPSALGWFVFATGMLILFIAMRTNSRDTMDSEQVNPVETTEKREFVA